MSGSSYWWWQLTLRTWWNDPPCMWAWDSELQECMHEITNMPFGFFNHYLFIFLWSQNVWGSYDVRPIKQYIVFDQLLLSSCLLPLKTNISIISNFFSNFVFIIHFFRLYYVWLWYGRIGIFIGNWSIENDYLFIYLYWKVPDDYQWVISSISNLFIIIQIVSQHQLIKRKHKFMAIKKWMLSVLDKY